MSGSLAWHDLNFDRTFAMDVRFFLLFLQKIEAVVVVDCITNANLLSVGSLSRDMTRKELNG